MAESPFIYMSASSMSATEATEMTEDTGFSLFPHDATISMVPSGPEWIARQNQQEIMSLSWGWSDGTATVSREQVDALSKRVAFVKKGMLGLVLVAVCTLLFCSVWILDDSPMTVPFLSITLIVSFLLYICADVYGRRLTSQLADMFSRGVLGKDTNHMMSDKGKEEQIQVTVHRFVQWTPRQTLEEILSVEGWTEEDLTVLRPLVQEKKVSTYLTNGALLAFLLWIFLPIIFPRLHEWQSATYMLVCNMLIFAFCWTGVLNGRVEQMFASRFMPPLSGPPGFMQPLSGPPEVV
jgi:hypothetical protein